MCSITLLFMPKSLAKKKKNEIKGHWCLREWQGQRGIKQFSLKAYMDKVQQSCDQHLNGQS